MTTGRGGCIALSRLMPCSCRRTVRGNARCPHFSLAIISVTVQLSSSLSSSSSLLLLLLLLLLHLFFYFFFFLFFLDATTVQCGPSTL